jgi:hypothetical protein
MITKPSDYIRRSYAVRPQVLILQFGLFPWNLNALQIFFCRTEQHLPSPVLRSDPSIVSCPPFGISLGPGSVSGIWIDLLTLEVLCDGLSNTGLRVWAGQVCWNKEHILAFVASVVVFVVCAIATPAFLFQKVRQSLRAQDEARAKESVESAGDLTQNETQTYTAAFVRYDANSSGKIDDEELSNLLAEKAGIKPSAREFHELKEEYMGQMHADALSLEDFLALMTLMKHELVAPLGILDSWSRTWIDLPAMAFRMKFSYETQGSGPGWRAQVSGEWQHPAARPDGSALPDVLPNAAELLLAELDQGGDVMYYASSRHCSST